MNSHIQFIIACSVSGGVTGYRESTVKGKDGAVKFFATRDEAETEAARLRDTMGKNSPATFDRDCS